MSFLVTNPNNRCFYCHLEFESNSSRIQPKLPNGCGHQCHVECERPAMRYAFFVQTRGRTDIPFPVQTRLYCTICQTETYRCVLQSLAVYEELLRSGM